MNNSTTFSAYKGIAQTPRTVARVCVGHLNGDFRISASVDIARKNGAMLHVHPSPDAVNEGKVDALIRCAIAYRDGRVEEVERWEQRTRGLEPDVVIYRAGGSEEVRDG